MPKILERSTFIRGDGLSHCPDCGARVQFDYQRGEWYCPRCGRVFGHSEETSFSQLKYSAEIHESRVVRGQFIHDEITAYENRVESVRKLYDTLSYQFPLARRVYEQALRETRQIIEDLNRGAYDDSLYAVERPKLKTWEIAFVALCRACELMDPRVSREDVVRAFIEYAGVEADEIKDGSAAFFKVNRVSPKNNFKVAVKNRVEAYVQLVRAHAELFAVELDVAGLKYDVFFRLVEEEAKKVAGRLSGGVIETVAAVAVAIALDRVCAKYSIENRLDESMLGAILGVKNLAVKRRNLEGGEMF